MARESESGMPIEAVYGIPAPDSDPSAFPPAALE